VSKTKLSDEELAPIVDALSTLHDIMDGAFDADENVDERTINLRNSAIWAAVNAIDTYFFPERAMRLPQPRK
jgi:hypothetical protein